MSKFILAFYGGDQPKSKEEGAAHMQKYQAWMQNLGDKLTKPGMPFGPSKTVSNDGVSDGPKNQGCMGLEVVEADSIDEAIEFAKSCPFLELNGSIEVTQVMSYDNC